MNESTSKEREPPVALLPFETPRDRPHTRGDCASRPRTCPWVACRYHLDLDLDIRSETGSIHLNAGARGRRTLPVCGRIGADEWLEGAADAVLAMPQTCALDVAEQDGATPGRGLVVMSFRCAIPTGRRCRERDRRTNSSIACARAKCRCVGASGARPSTHTAMRGNTTAFLAPSGRGGPGRRRTTSNGGSPLTGDCHHLAGCSSSVS